MIINTIATLDQVEKLSARQVGKIALDFSRIRQLKIKTSNGFVIPSETIKQIAHHNDLFSKIKLVEETADWDNEFSIKKNLKKVSNLIAKQTWPNDIAEQIGKHFEKIDQKDLFWQVITPECHLENVTGLANLFESILFAWSKNYSKDKSPTDPILILTQSQPDASGVAKIDREKKNLVQIKVVSGVYDHQLEKDSQPDFYTVNLSTNTIVSRQLNPRKNKLKRELDKLKTTRQTQTNLPAISDLQALEIAKYCQQINRQALGRRKVYFEVKKNQITVTKIFSPSLKSKSDHEVILLGQSVIGGFIEATAQIVKNQVDKHQFQTGNILVKKNLDHLDYDLMIKASAIILEDKSITSTTLQLLHEHHIPCVIGVNLATEKLYSNQRIIVDAGAGKILHAQAEVKPLAQVTTVTKIYLSAGNPYKANQYPEKSDGIFLKSDYAIAFIGVHPNHLLRTKKHFFYENLTKTISTYLDKKPNHFFYRSCNLNSQELASLKNAASYEKQEFNPYLGTRGALRILDDDEIFLSELEVVGKIANQNKKTINFVLPWVRTASELALLLKKVDKVLPKRPYLKMWLQLNTPANVLNLGEFLRFPIDGLTIQAKTIHDLSYGIDPDSPELERSYSFDSHLISAMLTNIATSVRKSKLYTQQIDKTLPVVLKLNHNYPELVSTATKLGLRAVVAKPSLFAIVKEQIISAQNQILKS